MAENNVIELALAETLPLLPEERSWSFRDMLAVKSGLAIATWGFLAGGATGQLVGFADGMVALFAGTALGIGLLSFALLLPVYRTGTEASSSCAARSARAAPACWRLCWCWALSRSILRFFRSWQAMRRVKC
jgi:hypothetical protein